MNEVTQEEKQRLEDAAKVARETADQAHQAAADADGADEALNKAADEAETAAVEAQKAADEAVVSTPPGPEAEAPTPPDGTDIDFEKELDALSGEQPPAPGKKLTELQKAERALFFQTRRVVELGGDPTKVVKPVGPAVPPAPAVPPRDEQKFVTQDDLDRRDLSSELRKLAKSDAERKVLEWHAEHSIKLTGDPVKDAENAYLIAHKGRITRSFDEIRRAVYSRPTPSTPPGRKPALPSAKAPELSLAEKAILQRRGFVMKPDGSWEGKKYRRYFDPKTRRWVEEKKP